MKCVKCGSDNLEVIRLEEQRMNKLVCCDCLAYQKFLSDKDAQTFDLLKKKLAERKTS